ncbi:MAG: hypothetical protein HON94_10710 [Methylococcales bacterium]|mgnify:FL=1|jgi:uncharacterized protein|nr:hypothetical protein [Methylococcales bacterium]MBT7411280.1 hypothetical protein [Methylococcales bacterium]
MKFILEKNSGYTINGYDAVQITINHKQYDSNVIVSPQAVVTDKLPAVFTDLTLEHCQYLVSLPIEILIIGTGESTQLLPVEYQLLFSQKQIGLECMNTAAACRTYNVILTEDRLVGGVFFIP